MNPRTLFCVASRHSRPLRISKTKPGLLALAIPKAVGVILFFFRKNSTFSKKSFFVISNSFYTKDSI
nr:MAG TPA: hypothetical protein [Caudoviricetes sp.]DAT71942.1 MAG TPA: hypothetical protein [Caudoviricetes sp.]